MPTTDPKSPEQRLEEARREAHDQVGLLLRAFKEGHLDPMETVSLHAAIDRLVQVARLVGRVEQHEGECIHALRDRLLAELEKETK